MNKIALAAAGMLAFSALPALAEESANAEAASIPDLPEAWSIINGLTEDQLGPKQTQLLDGVAFSLAQQAVCEDKPADHEQLAGDFDNLTRNLTADLTAEQAIYYQRHLLVNFGMRVGVLVAEGVRDRDVFCAPAPEFSEVEVIETETKTVTE